MSKHTPGPWRASYGLVLGPRGKIVAQAVTQPGEAGPEAESRRNDANAHLIAAAPDLLDALREIAKGEGGFSLDQLTHAQNTIEAMKGLARAALAKVEGVTR